MSDISIKRKNPRSLLQASEIAALKPPEKGRRTLREPGGLCYRLTEKGHRSWSVEIKVEGRFRRFTLGDGTMSLKEAREEAHALRRRALREGHDPVEVKRQARKARAEAKHIPSTLRVLVDEFGKAKGKELKSWPEMRRQLLHSWGDRLDISPDKLTKGIARDVLDKAAKRDAVISGKRAVQHLSRVLNWAVAREKIATNPLDGMDLEEHTRAEPPRQRTLTDDELRRVWEATATATAPFGDLVRLYLLTGLRRDELALARWADLAGDVLNVGDTKSGNPHRLPLSSEALAIVERQGTKGGEFIFRGPTGRPLTDATNWWRHRVAIHELSGTTGWSWHDLRRTHRTLLARSGTDDIVAELMLNHGLPGKLRQTYNLHRYEAEMRDAANRLAALVLGIVAGDGANVIAMRA